MPIKIDPTIKLRAYDIVTESVEGSLAYGIRRLFKHDSTPLGEDQILERLNVLYNAVMDGLCEVIDFGD